MVKFEHVSKSRNLQIEALSACRCGGKQHSEQAESG